MSTLHPIEETRTGPEEHGVVATGDDQPRGLASLIAADRDDDAGRLDAVAGSEFVDDRIRLSDFQM